MEGSLEENPLDVKLLDNRLYMTQSQVTRGRVMAQVESQVMLFALTLQFFGQLKTNFDQVTLDILVHSLQIVGLQILL